MNRGLSLRLLRLVLVLGLGLNLASAQTTTQTTLDAYTQAKTALETSIAATLSDSVASLDALRQAKQAFVPLGEALGGPLNQGLQVTFDRAEQAIINASPTDLKVQAAVLFGGFQRSLYEQALTEAQAGNAAQANRLLGVLGQDLELTPAQFSSPATSENPARALQLTFERRLAARSLGQLKALRAIPENQSTRDARYEVLGQLYSHVFLIQDSPRLLAATQVTVLDAIQALIARRTLRPSLTTLQTQLQDFQRASTAAQQLEAPTEPAQTAPATETAAEAATGAASAPEEAEAQRTEQGAVNAATTEPAASEAPATTEPDTKSRPTPEAPATATAAETDAQPATAPPSGQTEPVSEQAAATSAPAADPEAANDPTATAPEVADPTLTPAAPLPSSGLSGLLSEPVRAYLLSAAGLLALVGIVLLLAQAGASPVLNIATILLLLPVLAEGLIALGTVLAPLVGMPVLAQGQRYSLFVNPLMQVVWMLLAIGAGLSLLFTRRTGAATPQPAQTVPETKPSAPPPPRTPVSSAGRVNWDEDF